MEYVDYTRTIQGFRLMKTTSHFLFIPCLIVFLYCLVVDYKQKKYTTEHSDKSSFRKLNNTFLGIIAIVSVILFLIPLGIILLRLFHQQFTGEFGTGLLLSLFFSIIFVFTNVYFYFINADESSFSIVNKPLKEEPYYNVRLYLTTLYYSLYTLFTQGFGDITPANVTTRLVSGVHFFLSFIMTTYIFAKIIAYSDMKPQSK